MNQELAELGWWIVIITDNPNYIYHFGAFESYDGANSHIEGYIADLTQENAEIIDIQIKQFQPQRLTINLSVLDG